MNLVEIGGRIKMYRKSMGISQEKLAEMIFFESPLTNAEKYDIIYTS